MKKHSKKFHRPNLLIIGPYPPPTGGVATFIKSMMEQQQLNDLYNMMLYRTGRKKRGTSFLNQSVIEIFLLFKFLFTLKFKNIALFHIHTSSQLGYIRNIPYILLSKLLSRGKVVVHIHGGKFEIFYENANEIIKQFIKSSLKSTDCLIVTSSSWIEKIKKISNKSQNIYSITNGYNPRIFYPIATEKAREKINLPKDKKIILNIGVLEEWKGHRLLLESMRKILRENKDVVLYIIGEGSLRKKLEEDIKTLHLEEHIILAGGNKTPEEIALWINSSDLFVMPSFVEGNPTVMFECLACGKPFVGTTVGGIPDIIVSEDYGLLTKSGDMNDFTDKILLALNKKWDNEKILKYAENFTWDNIARKTILIYNQLKNEDNTEKNLEALTK